MKKIYVADFFSLADHLSKKTANLFEVQKRLLIIKEVMLLSHTVFQVDSVPVLKEYAVKYGVNDKNGIW
jgi:protein SCO1/2